MTLLCLIQVFLTFDQFHLLTLTIGYAIPLACYALYVCHVRRRQARRVLPLPVSPRRGCRVIDTVQREEAA